MKMKRNRVFYFTIILLWMASQSFASGKQPSTGPVSISGVGEIVYLEGEVFLNNRNAQIGDRVSSSDTIQTGVSSFCEVIFEDANVFRLDEQTITSINWAESDIALKQGGISAVFNKLDKLLREMKNFTVSTPTATAGVRGTVFYARVEDQNNTYVCICNGELDMTYGEKSLGIEGDHHKGYRFTNNRGTVTWSRAPLLYHDDQKMQDIATKIEYSVPWGKRENRY